MIGFLVSCVALISLGTSAVAQSRIECQFQINRFNDMVPKSVAFQRISEKQLIVADTVTWKFSKTTSYGRIHRNDPKFLRFSWTGRPIKSAGGKKTVFSYRATYFKQSKRLNVHAKPRGKAKIDVARGTCRVRQRSLKKPRR